MKILIVYATHGGVSRTCAQMLCEQLEHTHTVTLCSVTDNPPDPRDFDAVVVGGSVRFGHWNKKLKKYLREHRLTLSDRPTALFMCCGFPLRYEEYEELEVPKGLTCSLGVHYFGGELKPEKLRGLDKLIVSMVRQSILTQDFEAKDDTTQHTLPEILPEAITRLADAIRALK